MALNRPLKVLDPRHPVVDRRPDPARRVLGAVAAQAERAGLPLAYVDRNQRYRFVNKAFLDWIGKRGRAT